MAYAGHAVPKHGLFLMMLTWPTMRDFSSRYCWIFAPSITPALVKCTSMYFPKRLELSLRMVLALPKAVESEQDQPRAKTIIVELVINKPNKRQSWNPPSKSKEEATSFEVQWRQSLTCHRYICGSKNDPFSPSMIGLAWMICCSIHECWPLVAAKKFKISLVLSVFPAPLSPLQHKVEKSPLTEIPSAGSHEIPVHVLKERRIMNEQVSSSYPSLEQTCQCQHSKWISEQRHNNLSNFLPDNDTLVTLASFHEVVGVVCDGKDVRRHLSNLLVLIFLDVFLAVDGVDLIRVDGHQNATSEGLQNTP